MSEFFWKYRKRSLVLINLLYLHPSPSPLSSSITPSLFHSNLKTYLFHKSFPHGLPYPSAGLTSRIFGCFWFSRACVSTLVVHFIFYLSRLNLSNKQVKCGLCGWVSVWVFTRVEQIVAVWPSRNREKISRFIFSSHFWHSFHSQAHFLCYKFKIFVQSSDFAGGDWWLYFRNDPIFSPKRCQARQSLAFWGLNYHHHFLK